MFELAVRTALPDLNPAILFDHVDYVPHFTTATSKGIAEISAPRGKLMLSPALGSVQLNAFRANHRSTSADSRSRLFKNLLFR